MMDMHSQGIRACREHRLMRNELMLTLMQQCPP